MALFDIDLLGASAIDFANMTPYELGRNVFLPFILVFVILWVVLERIHVFGKKVNIIISLGISILLATTPAFTMFSTYITEVSGTSMLVIFGILLIGGTAVWALSRGRDIYYEQAAPEKKIMQLEKKIEKARRKGRIQAAEALEREKRQWEHRMREKYRR